MPEVNETQRKVLQIGRAITRACKTCSGAGYSCDQECHLYVWHTTTDKYLNWNPVKVADSVLQFCSNRCGQDYARCADRQGQDCPLHIGLRLSLRTFGKFKQQ